MQPAYGSQYETVDAQSALLPQNSPDMSFGTHVSDVESQRKGSTQGTVALHGALWAALARQVS